MSKKKKIKMVVESGGFSAHPIWGLIFNTNGEKMIIIPYPEYLDLVRNQIRPKTDIFR